MNKGCYVLFLFHTCPDPSGKSDTTFHNVLCAPFSFLSFRLFFNDFPVTAFGWADAFKDSFFFEFRNVFLFLPMGAIVLP